MTCFLCHRVALYARGSVGACRTHRDHLPKVHEPKGRAIYADHYDANDQSRREGDKHGTLISRRGVMKGGGFLMAVVFSAACNGATPVSPSSVASTPASHAPSASAVEPIADAPVETPTVTPQDGPLNAVFRDEYVAFWNYADVDKPVTVACFQVLSGTEQRRITEFLYATVPAQRMFFAIDYNYSGAGCGSTVQCDAVNGHRAFDWWEAEHKPGVLFQTPACDPPPPVCVDGDWSAWMPVSGSMTRNHKMPHDEQPQVCWEARTRMSCEAGVERETRQVACGKGGE